MFFSYVITSRLSTLTLSIPQISMYLPLPGIPVCGVLTVYLAKKYDRPSE
jgi:hypothetical protein